jgi:proteic killer suppression protein
VIASFRDKDTEKVADGIRVKRFEAIARAAQIRLLGLRIAGELEDLAVPPGNRLEALKGDRKGQHSIRINDQYRICFTWKEGAAHDVEIVDYHSQKKEDGRRRAASADYSGRISG